MYQWISKKLMIVVVLASVVLLTSVMMADEAPKPAVKNVTWEYKVINLNEPELNALGRAGWECMSVVPNITSGPRPGRTIDIKTNLTAVMKRQIK